MLEWGELAVPVIDLPPDCELPITIVQKTPLSVGGVVGTTTADVALLDVRRGGESV